MHSVNQRLAHHVEAQIDLFQGEFAFVALSAARGNVVENELACLESKSILRDVQITYLGPLEY